LYGYIGRSSFRKECPEKTVNKNAYAIFQLRFLFNYCLFNFSPAKIKWKFLVTSYFQDTHRKSIRKIDFPKLLDKLFSSSFSTSAVSGGFRRSGIWPYNSEAMKDKVVRSRSSNNNSTAT
jgi:hypothetical protein